MMKAKSTPSGGDERLATLENYKLNRSDGYGPSFTKKKNHKVFPVLSHFSAGTYSHRGSMKRLEI